MIAAGMKLNRIPGPVIRPLAWLAARLAARVRRFPLAAADPVRAIGRISPRPVFVIHGEMDQQIPVAAGRALFAAAGEPKELWVPEVAHTMGLEKVGPEYSHRVLTFFDRWLKADA